LIGGRLADAYLEIHYEDLVRIPFSTIGAVCRFLGISFSADLRDLTRPTESLGDASGVMQIMGKNVGKIEDQLDLGTVRSI